MRFRNIVLAYYHIENNNSNQYPTISSSSATYMALHYILFFLGEQS